MKDIKLDKQVLGGLIEYYRKEKGITRKEILNQCNMSLSTLRRLEEGKSNAKQYDTICEILNINLLKDNKAYEEIDSLLKATLNIINSGKPISEYYKLKDELSIFNNQYRDFIYLNELSLLGINTLSICLDLKILNKEMLKIFDYALVNSNNATIKLLSSYLLCNYAALFLRIEEEYRHYLSYVKNIRNHQINRLQEAYFDSFFMDIYEAYAKHKKMYLESKKDDILIYFTNICAFGCACVFIGKPKKAIELLNMALNLKRIEEILPKSAIISGIHSLAYAHFYAGNADKSYENYMEVYKTNPNLLETSYCFLFKILEYKKDTQQIANIINKNIDNSEGLTKIIFGYYKLKYIDYANDKELSKYIVKNLKYSNIKSKVCFDFFEKEMFELANRTKLFKLYFDYIGDMHRSKHFKLAVDDSPFM